MKTQFLSIAYIYFLLWFTNAIFSQKQPTFESKIMGEQHTILGHATESYKNSNRSYPVL